MKTELESKIQSIYEEYESKISCIEDNSKEELQKNISETIMKEMKSSLKNTLIHVLEGFNTSSSYYKELESGGNIYDIEVFQTIKECLDNYDKERVGKSGNKVITGRTRNNKIVHIPCDRDLTGEFVNVKITNARTWYLNGELI